MNVQGADGKTALMVAVRENNLDVMRELLAAGADVNAQNADGDTALILAVMEENLSAVRLLLAAGADVNAQCSAGCTALSWATTWRRNFEIAKALRAAGARS